MESSSLLHRKRWKKRKRQEMKFNVFEFQTGNHSFLHFNFFTHFHLMKSSFVCFALNSKSDCGFGCLVSSGLVHVCQSYFLGFIIYSDFVIFPLPWTVFVSGSLSKGMHSSHSCPHRKCVRILILIFIRRWVSLALLTPLSSIMCLIVVSTAPNTSHWLMLMN